MLETYGHVLRQDCILKDILEGKVIGKPTKRKEKTEHIRELAE